MQSLYADPCFTFRFADDRVVSRVHLDGVPALCRVSFYRIDPTTLARLDLLAETSVGEGGWVDLPKPVVVRTGDAFIAVPLPTDSPRSERAKMLAGELYDPLDPELTHARNRARDLCQDLNNTRERHQELRRRILVDLFGKGGDSVWMQPPFFCDYGSNISLGAKCFFNFNCVVLDVCEVTIGDATLFGPAVQIYAATHPMNAALRRKQESGKPIAIGSDVWVGGGAIVCPGVKIGSRSVIGAGSVVTRDIPESVFAAGNPCRIIREIDQS